MSKAGGPFGAVPQLLNEALDLRHLCGMLAPQLPAMPQHQPAGVSTWSPRCPDTGVGRWQSRCKDLWVQLPGVPLSAPAEKQVSSLPVALLLSGAGASLAVLFGNPEAFWVILTVLPSALGPEVRQLLLWMAPMPSGLRAAASIR